MEFDGNKKQLIKTVNDCIRKNKEYTGIDYIDGADD